MSEPTADVVATADEHKHFSYQQDALLTRLRRIEGQVRGVQRMVEEGRYCLDIVTQIHAITAAADRVSQQVLEEHIRGCVTDAIREQRGDEAISELMTVLRKAMSR
ncbi:MAG TPA: metal-sensitive transcriptional regulator [Nitrolancea sp.]|nr:metal-sensitive transcriptional regulator [Nitrolancea sp.]